eukprot:scaffold59466_cov57-Phaeocystis_antarctica.AAC.1
MSRGPETLQGAVGARYSPPCTPLACRTRASWPEEPFSLSRDENMVGSSATDRDITSSARALLR